jgi:formylglycine-generating enzyme required for sulfatase activity
VRITRPFYLGVYEVTHGQYEAVMGTILTAGGDKDGVAGQSIKRYPVESVSWLNAVRFCNKLSELEGMKPFYKIVGETVSVPDWKGSGYRLPTEAEWEYACRAGSTTRYSFGNDPAGLADHGWFAGNSGRMTHPVGQKGANGFGLHDMHGNVWEWCWDGYHDSSYKESPADDPIGSPLTAHRVVRGGSWSTYPRLCRSAFRFGGTSANRGSALGFRLALVQ